MCSSIAALGQVDLLYSHITSQVTAEVATAVLGDAKLTAALKEAKAAGQTLV